MAEVKKESFFARAGKFFRELRSELKKVVWPTPKQVVNNTLIVGGCCGVIGLFIWLFDFVANFVINGLISLVH